MTHEPNKRHLPPARSAEEYERLLCEAAERERGLVEALECAKIAMCAVAVPHAGERKVLQEGVDIVRAALSRLDVPAPEPPCDCISRNAHGWVQRCDCRNSGDLASAEAWCCEQNGESSGNPGQVDAGGEQPEPRHTVERIKALRDAAGHTEFLPSVAFDGGIGWKFCTDCGGAVWRARGYEREGEVCDHKGCPGTFRAPEPSAPCGDEEPCGLWRCSSCATALGDGPISSWRFVGAEPPQHKCEGSDPQAGHFTAEWHGPDCPCKGYALSRLDADEPSAPCAEPNCKDGMVWVGVRGIAFVPCPSCSGGSR
jgi:hypothetical protein